MAGKFFDVKVTGDELIKDWCPRADRGEIHIQQMIVLKNCGYHWRIIGREISAAERSGSQPGPSPKAGVSSLNGGVNSSSAVSPLPHLGANIGAAEARGPVGTKRGKSAFDKKGQSIFDL
jgi:hypothetical protein